jgi:Protein of unknown function (DUF2892)
MPRNIGVIDQLIRAVLGIAFIAYIAKGGDVMPGWILPVLVGAYFVVTSLIEYCPLYRVLGLTTVERVDHSS